MILLPFIALALWMTAATWRARSRRALSGRDGALLGAVAWGAYLTVVTEGLTIVRAFTPRAVAVLWGVAVAAGALEVWRLAHANAEWPRAARAASRGERFVLLAVAVVLVLTAVVALAAAPNTFDSMTYHMSRVAHWVADRGVQLYPTSILRQLHQAPWTEYAIAHLQLLSGGDRYANMVQWLAFAGSIVGVTAVAAQLGAGRRGQLVAALFCATLPMAIAQATSTQTDLVTAFWLVCAVHFFLRTVDRGEWSVAVRDWLAFGGALGLATLSKATAYLFAAPFLFWGAAVWLPRVRMAWRGLLLAAGVAMLLNAAYWRRNLEISASPLGPGAEEGMRYANGRFTVGVLASNMVRNAALHFGTPSERVNRTLEGGVRVLHGVAGLNANDSASSWMEGPFYIPPYSTHEDSAGNPLHLLLVAVAFGVLVVVPPRRLQRRRAALMAAALLGGALLFSGYLRWQPWGSRLQLPLFVLAAPLVGAVLERAPLRLHRLGAVVLLLWALPFLLHNESRPLVGRRNVFNTPRVEQYFSNWPELARSYRGAAAAVAERHCTEVGVVLGWNTYEYPLWALLQRDSRRPVRVEHLGVENASARFAHGAERPCAFIAPYGRQRADSIAHAYDLRAGWWWDWVTVYFPTDTLPGAPAHGGR